MDLTVKRSTISNTGTSLALSASTNFFGRSVNSTLGVKDGANNLGSVAVDYTYQNSTGDRTTEFVSSYKNVVTPATGTAANVEYNYTYDANSNTVSDAPRRPAPPRRDFNRGGGRPPQRH